MSNFCCFFFALFATDHTNWFIDMLLLIFKSPRFLDNKPLTFLTTHICIHCHYIYTYRPFIILFFGDFLFCYRSKESEKKIRAIKCTELPTVEWHQSYLLWSLQTKLNWRIYIYWKWSNRNSNQNFHDFCSVFINNFSNDENIHTFVW